MKKFILSVAAAIVMMAMFTVPASAETEFVCQTSAMIFSGPVNSANTDESEVVTGTMFRGATLEECGKAQALYTRLFGELLVNIYKTPDEGVKTGQILHGK